MPNKNDSRPYHWPKAGSKEETYYKSRVDQFPNGTQLRVYDQKLMTKQIKYSLDKISEGKRKNNH